MINFHTPKTAHTKHIIFIYTIKCFLMAGMCIYCIYYVPFILFKKKLIYNLVCKYWSPLSNSWIQEGIWSDRKTSSDHFFISSSPPPSHRAVFFITWLLWSSLSPFLLVAFLWWDLLSWIHVCPSLSTSFGLSCVARASQVNLSKEPFIIWFHLSS